jgi:hypothetical protein
MPTTTTLSLKDRLLLARPFEYETNFTLEDCEKRLRSLNRPREGFFDLFSSEVDVSFRYGRITFEIRYKQRNRGFDYTSAQAFGNIHQDENGKVIVKGYTRLGLNYVLIGIAMPVVAIIFGALSPKDFACFLMIGGLLTLFIWFTLISDYNKLTQVVYRLFD